jgi:hypothetical protein
MENMTPSLSSSIHQPDSGTKEMPFAQAIVHLAKPQYIQLKWNSRYWQRQHERAIAREAALKLKLEQAEATIRDLTQRLYGKQSEKNSLPSEAPVDDQKSRRRRGQTRGSKGHGRNPLPHLPVLEEWHVLPLDEQVYRHCDAAFNLFLGTEDCDIIEINVKALIIFVCDRYSAYKCWAKDFPLILLAFCRAPVRRDFLGNAKAWPELAEWMPAWVDAIGELYHLNAQRLAVWDEALPLPGQSPSFQVQQQALTASVEALSSKRNLALAELPLSLRLYSGQAWL